MHPMSNPSAHDTHQDHVMSASGEMAYEDHSAHAGHGVGHSGHEQVFRVRFWCSRNVLGPYKLQKMLMEPDIRLKGGRV